MSYSMTIIFAMLAIFILPLFNCVLYKFIFVLLFVPEYFRFQQETHHRIVNTGKSKQVLEYFSGNIPQNNLSAKNAEFRQADKKARELANAQQTIEEYLRQEQSQDHQKKKRNDLE